MRKQESKLSRQNGGSNSFRYVLLKPVFPSPLHEGVLLKHLGVRENNLQLEQAHVRQSDEKLAF